MRRVFALVLLFLLACQAVYNLPGIMTSLPAATPSVTSLVPASPTTTPNLPTSTPSAHTATPSSTPEQAPTPTKLAPIGYTLRFHPDSPLFVGDQVSVEVIAPPQQNTNDLKARLEFRSAPQPTTAEAPFSSFGIGRRSQATFEWVWNTAGLPAGEYSLAVSILPSGPSWTETVSLAPQSQAPPPEPQAAWAVTESDCCLVHYITGTAAERDLPALLEMADRQAGAAMQRLGVELVEPVQVTFLPRVLGHGGFAGSEVSISYLDRNYAGNAADVVLHHEIVHILDGRLGGKLRPSLFVEGLAVYLSGGHYKREPIMERAAALLPADAACVQAGYQNGWPYQPFASGWGSGLAAFLGGGLAGSTAQAGCGLDWYVPLARLADHFYFEQHEVGYLQAAALVEFMVETWGWQAFSDFYRNIEELPATASPSDDRYERQSRAIDAALRASFGITLDALEARFQEALRRENLTQENAADVRLTIKYYDTVRRYQQNLDPSAYFLTAWLPDNEELRKRGIVADYLRRPTSVENITFELMLVSADGDIRRGDYRQAAKKIQAVNATLDAWEAGLLQPFNAHPLAQDYLHLAQAVIQAGFTPQRLEMGEKTARVWVTTTGPELIIQNWLKQQEEWVLAVE